MNLVALRQRVRDRLQGDQDKDLRYTNTLVDEFLNDAQTDFTTRTGCVVGTTTISARPYTFGYALPADCVRVVSVRTNDDSEQKVPPISIPSLERYQGRWSEHTGTRFEWYFVGPGLSRIYLGPMPTTIRLTDVTVTYEKSVGLKGITTSTDPVIPEQFHEALVDYAVGRFLLVGATDPAKIQLAVRYLGDYEQSVRKCQTWRDNHRDKQRSMMQSWVRPL